MSYCIFLYFLFTFVYFKQGINISYTKITFKPDYARLGISGLTPDIVALFKKRVYDIAAVTDKSIKVKLNGKN